MDKEIRKEERKLAKKDAAVKTQAKQSRQTAVIKNENNLKERKPNDVGKNLKPKQADKSNHVNSTAPKETPKGLENALKSLNKEKIDSIIENTTTRFPNSPIVWLLDLSSFLNSRIDRDPQDMAFSQKPPGTYNFNSIIDLSQNWNPSNPTPLLASSTSRQSRNSLIVNIFYCRLPDVLDEKRRSRLFNEFTEKMQSRRYSAVSSRMSKRSGDKHF